MSKTVLKTKGFNASMWDLNRKGLSALSLSASNKFMFKLNWV